MPSSISLMPSFWPASTVETLIFLRCMQMRPQCDCSRRPVRYANQLVDQVERLIVDLKRGKPH